MMSITLSPQWVCGWLFIAWCVVLIVVKHVGTRDARKIAAYRKEKALEEIRKANEPAATTFDAVVDQ